MAPIQISCLFILATVWRCILAQAPAENWNIFSDNFDGSTLNRTVWNTVADTFNRTGSVDKPKISAARNTDAGSTVHNANGTVRVGCHLLHWSADRLNNSFACGKLGSQRKFTFQYGVVEWKVRFPKNPRIVAYLRLVPGEIMDATSVSSQQNTSSPDDLPWSGYPTPYVFLEGKGDWPLEFGVRYGPYREVINRYSIADNFTDGFHTFKFLWTPNRVEWAMDGEPMFYNGEEEVVPKGKMWLMVAAHVADHLENDETEETDQQFPANIELDYVRVREVLPTDL